MKNLLVLMIALMFLIPIAREASAAPITEPAANIKRFQIKGTAESRESYDISHPSMIVNGSGFGSATELGQFTIVYRESVNLPDLSAVESAQFIETISDRIDVIGVGQLAQDTAPGIYTVTQIYKVTGGTGRFAGASGTITVRRTMKTMSESASSTFEGYLFIP